ncbi:hypothetical protein IWW54_003029 [Coemansia sp. RSA 2705]|nr:hypothetical protein IWW54_003029 [Coemansia sp. RSA 2705]
MTRSQLRRAAVAFAFVLGVANIYFYNYAALFAAGHPESTVRFNLYGDPQIEGDAKLKREPTTGKYDLLVNDYYLHHVYTSTISAFQPHYVVTMGDMFSNQWVKKDEYYRRIARFKWIAGQADKSGAPIASSRLYMHLAGNHDIGYGDETRSYHINRYTNNFGPLNQEWTIDLDQHSSQSTNGMHRIAIINAMNLDRTREAQFRNTTWEFVLKLAAERALGPEIPLVLFLHVPLSKPDGLCATSPETRHKDGYVKYQDYLSPATSAYLLHCLAPSLVFNGHDHDGCLSMHQIERNLEQPVTLPNSTRTLQKSDDLCRMSLDELDRYQAEIETFARKTLTAVAAAATDMSRLPSSLAMEVTVRSAMGAYGGAAGIFDMAYDRSGTVQPRLSTHGRGFTLASRNKFQYRYREVQFGNHLIIRALLIIDILSAVLVPAVLLLV